MVNCMRYTHASTASFAPFQKRAHAAEYSAKYTFKQC